VSGNLKQQISANAVIASRPPTAQASGTGEQGTVTRRLRKFLELTPEDRLLLLKLWFLLPFVAALLWLLDCPRTLRLLARWLPADIGQQQQADGFTPLGRGSGVFPPPGQGGGQEAGRKRRSEPTSAMCRSLRHPTHSSPGPGDAQAAEGLGAAERIGPANTVPDAAMSYALRLGRFARIAGCYVPTNGSCLRQSLLVWWLLRRQGVPAELRIGVRKQEGFAAHAWVEVGDQPVNDAPDVAERFAPFDDSRSARLASSP
jgi:hypothetical protein